MRNNFTPYLFKDPLQMAFEWDNLAYTRMEQILGGQDITFSHILYPEISRLISDENHETLIDAGCGVGIMARELSHIYDRIIGIDPSMVSIKLANSINENSNCRFLCDFFENSQEIRKCDTIIANMVLMDVVFIEKFLLKAAKSLKTNGSFLFSITHPCFWPSYYGYAEESWFNYNQTIFIESPFRISLGSKNLPPSTHIHRPLNQYIASIRNAGLELVHISEPMPTPEIENMYPHKWSAPRYLVGKCKLRKGNRAIY